MEIKDFKSVQQSSYVRIMSNVSLEIQLYATYDKSLSDFIDQNVKTKSSYPRLSLFRFAS